MSDDIPLYLALHLVPYLDPTDIGCARRVCKAWYQIFSSSALAQVALRVHFPLCREIQCSSGSQLLDYSIFKRVSIRYATLRSGVPRQELRIPIARSNRGGYVWTFSENLLVLLSSHHPRAVLTLIYLDARTESRRIINGERVLDAGGDVTGVKVCRDILVVERISSRNGPQWLCATDCFRVSLSPGNSQVITTKVSSFETFGFISAILPELPISDHSGKYYAVYPRARTPSRAAVQIWDIETGEMVRRIPDAEFPEIPIVMNILVIAKRGPYGPQQVVITGNDGSDWLRWGPDRHPPWAQATTEWDYVEKFKVFPIEVGSLEWTGRIAHTEQQSRSRPLTLEVPLASTFKVPRCPAGITSLDTPDTPGYLGEEIGLTLWHWNSEAGNVYSYHSIVPDHPPASGPDAPLAVEREFRVAFTGTPCYSPFNVGFRSGLSLTMDVPSLIKYLGRSPILVGSPMIPYELRVRCFYPSATPGVMDLDWETRLKSSRDKRKTQKIYITNRKYMDFEKFLHMAVIDGSELATAFLGLGSGVMELVLVLWEKLHGELPLGSTVLD